MEDVVEQKLDTNFQELFRFFDSQQWRDFKDELPYEGTTIKTTLIDRLTSNISSRKITIENVFLMHSYSLLYNSFLLSPNMGFLHQCFLFYQQSILVLPFLENIFLKSPQTIIQCLEIPIFSTNLQILQSISRISLFLTNFNPMSSLKFLAIFKKINIDIVLKEIISFINSTPNNQLNFDVFSTLISNLSRINRHFWELFDALIGDNRCQFLGLLQSTFNNDEEDEYDLIIEKVPSISQLIESFLKTRQIPQFIIKLYQKDKPNFDYLINSIQRCNKKGKDELLRHIQQQKLIDVEVDFTPIMQSALQNEHSVTITSIISYMDRSQTCCEQFSPKLLNIFHQLFVKQTAETVKSFVNQFYSKVIKLMQFQTIDTFTEVAMKFLKSDLLDQHRSSLSVLILRLPITKYVPDLFFDQSNQTSSANLMKEIRIIEGLHKAAIQTCNYLTVNAASSFSSPKPHGNQLTIHLRDSNDDNQSTVGFDKRILMRLRWRTLRGDSSSNLSFLPEFIQLCDSDERLFVRWESQMPKPDKIVQRSQILAKLGITTNKELISSLINELLRIKAPLDKTFLQIVIPIFSNNCDVSSLKIPENPNLNVLFRFNILWCSSVMCHLKVIERLRNPSIEMSASLFRCLVSSPFFCNDNNEKINSDHEKLFSIFPLGFSALLANSASFSDTSVDMCYLNHENDFFSKYPKPPKLILAEQILNQTKVPPTNMPRYFVISVVFESAKKSPQHIEWLANHCKGDELWISICFFFAVVFNHYEIAVNLLSSFEFLFNYLRKSVNEENLFVGKGKLKDGLIQFSLFCNKNEISFDHKEWKALTTITRTPQIQNGLYPMNAPIQT